MFSSILLYHQSTKSRKGYRDKPYAYILFSVIYFYILWIWFWFLVRSRWKRLKMPFKGCGEGKKKPPS